MADYEFKNGAFTAISDQYGPTKDYSGKRRVLTMLGDVTIRYPVFYNTDEDDMPLDFVRRKGKLTQYHFCVELLDDYVWLERLPDLVQFAQLIGMKQNPTEIMGDVILSLQSKTDLLELIELIKIREENAE